MPEIAFEQAHTVCRYLEKQEHLLKYFYHKNSTTGKNYFLKSRQMQNDIIKNLIYTTWTDRFQTDKPVLVDRADKQSWIFNHPEFYQHRESFVDLNSLALTQLDPKFYAVETDGIQYKNKIRGMFKTTLSKWHFVKLKESI
jgi:hypothetical protein